MRKYCIVIFLMLLLVVSNSVVSVKSLADSPMAKELQITQIKITGDEFVVLHNATSSNLNLGNFWLQYYNEFNLSVGGVSNSSQQLPAVILQPNQEILLAVGAAANCGQVWVSKLSFSLKDSAGLLQVVGVSQSSGMVSYKSEDQVSWSSKTTDNVDIKGVSSTSAPIWYRSANGWLSSSLPIGCTAVGTAVSTSTSTPATLNRINSSPPSVVLGASTNEITEPVANQGLNAPQISELLPNPASPQTDATDEFIELYNPNDTNFDLSGYVLRTGSSTYHNYTFPTGQFVLQPHEFRAFYAPQTGIVLSNSEGQAALLDPNNNLLTETDIYQNAKDGQAWVYADGLWQWTTTATPNSANIIITPVIAFTKKTNASKITKAKVASSKLSKKTVSSSNDNLAASSFAPPSNQSSLLHPLVLAVVAGLAVLYACYEYRNDIANLLYRYRRHRTHRRGTRQFAEGT